MKQVVISRADPLEFFLSGDRTFIVAPATRAQLRAALEFDPAPGEVRSPAESGEQRAQQLAVLLGESVSIRNEQGGVETVPSAPILATLTTDEEMQILGAIMAQGHGQDPAAQNAMHSLAKKKAVLSALSGSPHLIEILSNLPISSDAQPETQSASDSSKA